MARGKIPAGLFASFAYMSTDDITAYLDNQGIVLTQSYADLWEEANAHAKTIVGETRVDIIADVFNHISDNIKFGKGSAITGKEIAEALAKKGWYYGGRGGVSTDGEITGSVRRLKNIARQNMSSAYSAGRWKRFDANRANRPYIQYVAIRDESSRPTHAAQHLRIYHIDDPIWDVMWPSNGFHCRCRVRALAMEDLKRRGLFVSKGEVNKEDIPIKKTDLNGNSALAKYRYRVNAEGSDQAMTIDAGFGYNGGKEQAKPFIPALGDITVENAHLLDRVVDSDKILASDLSAEQYAAAFLAEFDIKAGETRYFTDAAGEVIPINASLLTTREDGKPNVLKAGKRDRGQYMKLLAETFKSPDEIWLTFENEKGKWILKRHYLRVIDLGESLFALGVFKREGDIWYGSTVFQLNETDDQETLLEKLEDKRQGLRLYQKSGGATPTDTI